MVLIQYSIYKKIVIDKCLYNGYYIVNSKKGYLKADTLKGIKTLINNNIKDIYKI